MKVRQVKESNSGKLNSHIKTAPKLKDNTIIKNRVFNNCRLSKEKETRGQELLKQLRKKRKSKNSKK